MIIIINTLIIRFIQICNGFEVNKYSILLPPLQFIVHLKTEFFSSRLQLAIGIIVMNSLQMKA